MVFIATQSSLSVCLLQNYYLNENFDHRLMRRPFHLSLTLHGLFPEVGLQDRNRLSLCVRIIELHILFLQVSFSSF